MADTPFLATQNPHIVLMVMDRASSTVTLVRSDKKEAAFPLEHSPFHADSRITRLNYAPHINAMYLETVHGEDIFAELPEINDPAPRRGRTVVYLDQKDWSTIANTLYVPAKVPKAERNAAERLITLVREKKIILPMSSGHMSETCKWTDDERRYHLALTILQLSFGWQMRDPLDVRRFELRQSFTTKFKEVTLEPREVFTLEPYAIHGETRDQRHPDIPTKFPPDVALATAALTSLSSNFDVMLGAEPIPAGSTPGWVDKNQTFGDWLASEKQRTPLQRRQSIDALFLADTRNEIAEEAFRAGITPGQMSEWVFTERDSEIQLMPSLGLFRETLLVMHLNQTRWEGNHLTDLMYLTCASGYADYVVAEKSLVGYMQQALKRLKRPINVYRRIQDLVPVLEEQLSA